MWWKREMNMSPDVCEFFSGVMGDFKFPGCAGSRGKKSPSLVSYNTSCSTRTHGGIKEDGKTGKDGKGKSGKTNGQYISEDGHVKKVKVKSEE